MITDRVIERFIDKIDKSGECWEWTAGKDPDGYGIFHHKKSVRAHRFAYKIFKGDVPSGMCICHICDNPGCVNPDHMWIGSVTENNRDRESKGRSDPQHGERGHNAKLKNYQAEEIRVKYIPRKYTYQMLADEYGLCPEAIRNIIKNKTYQAKNLRGGK
jgi:hypothetical protein